MTSQSGGGGGGASPITTPGDLIVGNGAGSATRLPKGTDGAVLTTDPTSHLPAWDTIPRSSLPTLDKARYKTGTGQGLTNSTLTIINFDTVDYDTNTLVTTGAAWKFTAKAAGQYQVLTAIYLENTTYAAGNQLELFLYKNGAQYSILARPELQTAGTYRVGLQGTDTATLAVGDTLDVRAEVFLNVAGSTIISNNVFNYVSIALEL